MASSSTLTAKNLEALGAARLASLLIEISTGSAQAKRRLRLELAGNESPRKLAHEIRKRLTSIRRATTFVDWEKTKTLSTDLEAQRRLIVDQISASDPALALDLMWEFLDLADSIYERTNDGSGALSDIFTKARQDLGTLAQLARPDAMALAKRLADTVSNDEKTQFAGVITILAPALGPQGLDHLKQALSDLPRRAGAPAHATYAHPAPARAVTNALLEIADTTGDVDAYQTLLADRQHLPAIAADIAGRLLKAGRATDALTALDAAASPGTGSQHHRWEQTRAEVLEALGRDDEAQAFRLACFHRQLNPDHLRAYLKRLPDFDDIEAEDQAIAYVQTFQNVYAALSFLLRWPALPAASELVLTRISEIDGDLYELLTDAAERLSAKYPLAATMLLRSMIDFALDRARSNRYPHAARHLAECAVLATRIDNFADFPAHDGYLVKLKTSHGRKYGFWSAVG